MQFLIEAVMLSVARGLVGTAIGVGSTAVVGVVTPMNSDEFIGMLHVKPQHAIRLHLTGSIS